MLSMDDRPGRLMIHTNAYTVAACRDSYLYVQEHDVGTVPCSLF